MTTVCTTYYDPRRRNVSSLSMSAARFGIEVANFGYKDKFEGFLRTKLVPLRRFLKKVKTELVLFLDGSDTIVTSSLRGIEKSWKSVGGGSIVVGGEVQIWPYPHLKPFLVERAGRNVVYPGIDTGFIMGRTEDVAKMLDVVIDSAPRYRTQFPDIPIEIIEDDVGLVALNLADGKIDVVIDYNCELIVAMKSTPDEWYEVKEGKLHLGKTGTVPHVVHFNGHAVSSRKKMRKVSIELLGYSKSKIRKHKTKGQD